MEEQVKENIKVAATLTATVPAKSAEKLAPKDNKSLQIMTYTIITVLIFVAGYMTGMIVYGAGQRNSNFNLGSNDLSVSDFSLTIEAYEKLKQLHLNKQLPETKKLIEGSTKGLISALEDKYTSYYTAEEWEEIQTSNSGQFEGIGIKLIEKEDYVGVETPIVGSPAAKAGIMAEDLIIEVEGKSVKGLNVSKVADKIRGPEGTSVALKVFRPKASKQLDFKVTRAKIDIKSIEFKELPDNGLQIIVSKFTESEMSEFKAQWDAAINQAQVKNSKYIVLDLRNNTGGWVTAAQYILEDFLPQNTLILREVDRDGNEVKIYTSREGKLKDIKLSVLVNEGSASASEIVAGALQDLNRAKLVGRPTVGKGVEQTIQRTSDGGVMFIVFKKWLTPNGKNLSQSEALKPDKDIDLTAEDVKSGKDPQLTEAQKILN